MLKLHEHIELLSIAGTSFFQVNEWNYFHSSIVGTVTIRKGQLTDLASIPWFARWLYARSGPHKDAAIIHDIMLQQQKYTRKQADQVFKEALIDSGISRINTTVLYAAVRLYGFFSQVKERIC